MTNRADRTVVAAYVVLAAAIGGLHLVPHRGLQLGATLLLVGVATIAWIVVIRAILGERHAPSLRGALVVVVGLRAIALPLEPELSDDVYRYVHEGSLVLAGENPFLVAPSDPRIAELRGPEWSRINNPDIPAAYPPAVQLASAAGVVASGGRTIGVKLVFALFDVGTFLMLWGLCRALGSAPQRALIAGLCPLAVLEFAGEGHGDSLAACAMVASLWAARAGRTASSGLSLAVAAAGKWLPGVLLPFVARGRGARAWIGFAILFVLLWLPFVSWSAPTAVLDGTLEYASRWRHNDTVYALVHEATLWCAERGLIGEMEVQRAAKWPLAMLGVGLLIWLWCRRATPERAAFWFFAFFVACAPTVHPWYVAGLFLPWLALRPNVWLLAFCGTILIADHPVPSWLRDGVWHENAWAKVVTWAPFYVGVAIELSRSRQRLIHSR